MAHAILSPSSAKRWMTCPGSVRLTEGLPDTGSAHAAEGTAAHELAEHILNGVNGADLVGRPALNGVEWTQEMLQDVLRYTDGVQSLVQALGATLLVEQRLPISEWTGEDGAHGTSDAVLLAADELIVCDLKFGRGVEVAAEDNEQLQIYALAALQEFDIAAGPFARVRIIISQPRLGAWSEWSIPTDELLAFGELVKVRAAATRAGDAPLVPSAGACKWCKAAATCPAIAEKVRNMFEDVRPNADLDAEVLGAAMLDAPLAERWVKAVRAETERRLLAGLPVKGFKLVQGKQGNRAWSDPVEAETMLKSFRLRTEEMYDLSLISPTAAERLLAETTDAATGEKVKPAIGPRQWKKILPLITRAEGKPSVAPESDKREALVLTAASDAFDNCQTAEPTPLEASPESFV